MDAIEAVVEELAGGVVVVVNIGAVVDDGAVGLRCRNGALSMSEVTVRVLCRFVGEKRSKIPLEAAVVTPAEWISLEGFAFVLASRFSAG